jgi:hypothetical protein
MNRALAALSAALWALAVGWVAAGPVVPGLPGLLTGAAICSTVCTVIRANGLTDVELVNLALLAGRATTVADESRLRAEQVPAARRGPDLTKPLP